jgi:glycosyltransferase involved in cell wall biosynthesis
LFVEHAAHYRSPDSRPYTLRVTLLTAVIITKDEEQRLPACLESVAFCDELLVVDSGSSDGTRDVAKAKGARVVVNEPWPGFAAQRNFGFDAASHDWILFLDADEQVSGPLRAEIQSLRRSGFDRDGYRVPRVARYLGRWVRATDWYPDWQLRLFDRRKGRCKDALVHESVELHGAVGRLRGELLHEPYRDIADHVQTIDQYTTLWARQAFDSGRRASAAELVLWPACAFLRNYLLRGGLLLGRTGLTISVLNSYYTFQKYAKLLERQDGAPPA